MDGSDRAKLIELRQPATIDSSVDRAERARLRFAKALQHLSGEKLDHRSLMILSELEMLEAATDLAKQK